MKKEQATDFDFEDYLAGAKHNLGNYSFKQLFRLLFKKIHGLSSNKAVAVRLGMTESRLSQCLKNPSELTLATIRTILDQFEHPDHRRYLLRAYLLESLDEDFIADRQREYKLGDETPGEIRAQIKLLKNQGRLITADTLCVAAAEKSTSTEFKFFMYFQAFQLRETLAQYGFAHRMAFKIIELAKEIGDEYREIYGHSMRLRIKARCPRFAVGDVAEEFETLRQRLQLLPPAELNDKRILIPTDFYLWHTRYAVMIGASEQGYFQLSKELATRIHSEIEAWFSRDPSAKRTLTLLRARLYGVTGKYAALVEELSDFVADGNPDIHMLRHVATLQALAKVEEDQYEDMFLQLRQLYQTSMSFQDYARARVAQLRIAELGEKYLFDAELQ
ncbi:MAG: hypothetical protein LCH41_03885 [Armatimonadetes bacterium]|nr:hypothetical protein [Armatimonadota bacterium]